MQAVFKIDEELWKTVANYFVLYYQLTKCYIFLQGLSMEKKGLCFQKDGICEIHLPK